MANYDVFIQKSVTCMGATRTVLVPYASNPVGVGDGHAAIAQAAADLAGQFSNDEAVGTYVAYPTTDATTKDVHGFGYVPQMDS